MNRSFGLSYMLSGMTRILLGVMLVGCSTPVDTQAANLDLKEPPRDVLHSEESEPSWKIETNSNYKQSLKVKVIKDAQNKIKDADKGALRILACPLLSKKAGESFTPGKSGDCDSDGNNDLRFRIYLVARDRSMLSVDSSAIKIDPVDVTPGKKISDLGFAIMVGTRRFSIGRGQSHTQSRWIEDPIAEERPSKYGLILYEENERRFSGSGGTTVRNAAVQAAAASSAPAVPANEALKLQFKVYAEQGKPLVKDFALVVDGMTADPTTTPGLRQVVYSGGDPASFSGRTLPYKLSIEGHSPREGRFTVFRPDRALAHMIGNDNLRIRIKGAPSIGEAQIFYGWKFDDGKSNGDCQYNSADVPNRANVAQPYIRDADGAFDVEVTRDPVSDEKYLILGMTVGGTNRCRRLTSDELYEKVPEIDFQTSPPVSSQPVPPVSQSTDRPPAVQETRQMTVFATVKTGAFKDVTRWTFRVSDGVTVVPDGLDIARLSIPPNTTRVTFEAQNPDFEPIVETWETASLSNQMAVPLTARPRMVSLRGRKVELNTRYEGRSAKTFDCDLELSYTDAENRRQTREIQPESDSYPLPDVQHAAPGELKVAVRPGAGSICQPTEGKRLTAADLQAGSPVKLDVQLAKPILLVYVQRNGEIDRRLDQAPINWANVAETIRNIDEGDMGQVHWATSYAFLMENAASRKIAGSVTGERTGRLVPSVNELRDRIRADDYGTRPGLANVLGEADRFLDGFATAADPLATVVAILPQKYFGDFCQGDDLATYRTRFKGKNVRVIVFSPVLGTDEVIRKTGAAYGLSRDSSTDLFHCKADDAPLEVIAFNAEAESKRDRWKQALQVLRRTASGK